MSKYETQTAAAVVGLAGFQLLQLWNNNAPSLSEVRQASPMDNECRQKLQDAEILVGSVAVILGTAFAVLTKDGTALLVMLAIFGLNVAWYHTALNNF